MEITLQKMINSAQPEKFQKTEKKISFGPKCAKMDSDGEELAYHKLRNQIKRLTRKGKNNGEKDCETNTKQPQILLYIWAVETKHSGRYPRS